MCRRDIVSKLIIMFLLFASILNCFSATVFAIEATDKGNIVVNGVEKGTDIFAYRLMNINYDVDVQQPKDPMYQWTDEMASWVKNNYPEFINIENKNAVKEAFSQATDVEVAEFYDKLAVTIKQNKVRPVQTEVKAEGESVIISGLEMGNYFILIEGGARVYRPLSANVVPEWNGTAWAMTSPVVEAKASTPGIVKRISGNLMKDNRNIGHTVSYELLSTVPSYPDNAIARRYVISDRLSEGLTLEENSIKVYGVNEGAEPVLLTTGYTKTVNRPDGVDGEKGVTFSLEFDYDTIAFYTSIKILYKATLNEKAVIGNEGNLNHAYLDYSNNPYNASSWKTDEELTTVYTYAMEITKTDEDTDDKLAGAEFVVEKDGKKILFAGVSGKYHVAKDDEKTTEKVITGSDGILRLDGLDAGIYMLTEVKAPDGYVKLQNPIELSIVDEDMDGKIETGGKELESGILPVTVKNDKGFILPVTGGTGTVVFNVVGTILICSALLMAVVIIIRKRSSR